jgi:predicted ATPase
MSKEVRKLINKWKSGGSWPKRLEWLEIHGIRGWEGQRLDFLFPFVAIVGENGSGKSSILQAAASVYRSPDDAVNSYFTSDFFPDTPWDRITNATVNYSVREGDKSTTGSVRKPTTRWRGNPKRRMRTVYYIDLRRLSPYAAQVGFSRLCKPQFKEVDKEMFTEDRAARLSSIIGREYRSARYSLTDADDHRRVPVLQTHEAEYSGFHQGAGETTVADLVRYDFKPYSIVLVDELETSLHPRSQRRLIRDLAEQCREKELQILVTTHSPYVLQELPVESRVYVMRTKHGRELVTGVSPDFALTRMNEESHPEVDVYVEDDISRIMFEEIVARYRLLTLPQCEIIPYGAASVGVSLGRMVAEDRFPRKSLVFLDGDQEKAEGCLLLPGDESPERTVFDALAKRQWAGVSEIIHRSHAELVNAVEAAMTTPDHHIWIKMVADRIVIGGHELWRAMCVCWADFLPRSEAMKIIDALEEKLNIRGVAPTGRLFTGMDYMMSEHS